MQAIYSYFKQIRPLSATLQEITLSNGLKIIIAGNSGTSIPNFATDAVSTLLSIPQAYIDQANLLTSGASFVIANHASDFSLAPLPVESMGPNAFTLPAHNPFPLQYGGLLPSLILHNVPAANGAGNINNDAITSIKIEFAQRIIGFLHGDLPPITLNGITLPGPVIQPFGDIQGTSFYTDFTTQLQIFRQIKGLPSGIITKYSCKARKRVRRRFSQLSLWDCRVTSA